MKQRDSRSDERTRALFAKAAACSLVDGGAGSAVSREDAPPPRPIDLLAAADAAFLTARFAEWQRLCGAACVLADRDARTLSTFPAGTVQRLRFEPAIGHGGDLVVRAVLETEILRVGGDADAEADRSGAQRLAFATNLHQPSLGALVVRSAADAAGDGAPAWILCDRMSVWMWQSNLPWTTRLLRMASVTQSMRAMALRNAIETSDDAANMIPAIAPPAGVRPIAAETIAALGARCAAAKFDTAAADERLAELAEAFTPMGGRGVFADGLAVGVVPLPPLPGDPCLQQLRLSVSREVCPRSGPGLLWRCHLPLRWVPPPLCEALAAAIEDGVGIEQPALAALVDQVGGLDRIVQGVVEEPARAHPGQRSLPGVPEADGIGAWAIDGQSAVRSFFTPAELDPTMFMSHLLVSQLCAAVWARALGAPRSS